MTLPSAPLVIDATALPTPHTAQLRFLPEGPIPLEAAGCLSWVGIQHGPQASYGSINLLNLATGENQSFDLPGRPGFAFACSGTETRFVAGVERSLGIFDISDSSWTPFCEGIDADVDNTIINDGVAYGDNLIFGTKDLEFSERKAGLYLFRGRDRVLIRLRDDQICSNGKMIRTDDAGQLKLIDIDSPTKKIVQHDLDIDAGTIGAEHVLVDLTNDPGVPDGAILTPDGNGIIVSIYLPDLADYGETRQYDRETGRLQCVWRTPGSPQNTCPALVVDQGRVRLVITTAVENMSDENREKCPNAGQLFIAETDFQDPAMIVPPVFSWGQ
ncbi:SMP-30/gluconolactonase/LRE family protein [Allorhodopirellula heiligendammensis]|uniref:SMP-30/Gluconolaconase/LRE-like region n=1 Tax=Allorhodopirellula heiligendammensis TaxID=2714739 RepID=A0A5C6C0R2_9BACT|nr:SMP-30/gluconolactonase/LRE family protein [Allorhodopirellula heiligendammensis]TWU18153.1 SMP-30/Gluconolaconase/LRE-like region [Allorhodopirellula heiligendammensis]